MIIKKRCNKSGCKNYINTTDTYCDEHTNNDYKDYEQARLSTKEGREYKRFYDSKDWRTLRYQVLLDAGFICKMCESREATIGDHIIPTKVNWEKRLDRENIQALCVGCHNKKTIDDKKVYGV